MPRRVEILDLAELESLEARLWYATRSPEAADRFMKELDRAIAAIAEHPERWPTHIRNTRRYRLARFPLSLVYTFDADHVRVIALAHAKRRPGYWLDRI